MSEGLAGRTVESFDAKSLARENADRKRQRDVVKEGSVQAVTNASSESLGYAESARLGLDALFTHL